MKIGTITLWLSPACNLHCRYCFQDKKGHLNSGVITEKEIDDFIDFCIRHNISKLHFYGGEPLLYKDIFKYTVKKFWQKIPKALLSITTNGTLIDEEIMKLFEDFNFGVLLSLDGNRERHNRYREGFENIAKWFSRLTRLKRVSVAMQISEVDDLYKNVKDIWSFGFKHVYLNIIDRPNWYQSLDSFSKFEFEYEKAIIGMLQGEGFLNCALGLHSLQEDCKPERGCASTRNGLAADWTGKLFPCLRFVELGKRWSIGDIYKGIDKEREKQIREQINCEINKVVLECDEDCSYCLVSAFQNFGSFGVPHPKGWCNMLEIKRKMISKYYYKIQTLKQHIC